MGNSNCINAGVHYIQFDPEKAVINDGDVLLEHLAAFAVEDGNLDTFTLEFSQEQVQLSACRVWENFEGSYIPKIHFAALAEYLLAISQREADPVEVVAWVRVEVLFPKGLGFTCCYIILVVPDDVFIFDAIVGALNGEGN